MLIVCYRLDEVGFKSGYPTGKPDGFFRGTCGSNVPPANDDAKVLHKFDMGK